MDIREAVLRVVERETGKDVEESTSFEDLGLDSLDLLDLLLAVSVATGRNFDNDAVMRLETVGDLVRLHE